MVNLCYNFFSLTKNYIIMFDMFHKIWAWYKLNFIKRSNLILKKYIKQREKGNIETLVVFILFDKTHRNNRQKGAQIAMLCISEDIISLWFWLYLHKHYGILRTLLQSLLRTLALLIQICLLIYFVYRLQEEIKQVIYLKFIVFMFTIAKTALVKCVESTFFSKKLYFASYLLNTFHFQQNCNSFIFQISKSGKHGNELNKICKAVTKFKAWFL